MKQNSEKKTRTNTNNRKKKNEKKRSIGENEKHLVSPMYINDNTPKTIKSEGGAQKKVLRKEREREEREKKKKTTK